MKLLKSSRLRHQWLGVGIFLIAAIVVLGELLTVPLVRFSVMNVSIPEPPDWFGAWRPIQSSDEAAMRESFFQDISSDQMEVYSRGELALTEDPDSKALESTRLTGAEQGNVSLGDGDTASLSDIRESLSKTNPKRLEAGWLLQVASFRELDNATALKLQLLNAGFRAFVQSEQLGDQTFNRVYVGPEMRREDSEAQRSQLKETFAVDAVLKPFIPRP